MYLELQRLGENYSLPNIKRILSRQLSPSDVPMIMGSSARRYIRPPQESDGDMHLRLLNTNYLEFFNSLSLLQRFNDFFNQNYARLKPVGNTFVCPSCGIVDTDVSICAADTPIILTEWSHKSDGESVAVPLSPCLNVKVKPSTLLDVIKLFKSV